MKTESRWQSDLPDGLTIRGGRYYADLQFRGRRYRKSLKTRKKALAVQLLKSFIARVANGELDETNVSKSLTIGEWADEYQATHMINRVQRARVEYGRVLQNEIVSFLGRTTVLEQIGPAQLLRMRATLWGNVSAATQNRKMVLVKHFFSEARRRKLIENDPARDIPKLKELSKPSRILSETELKQLILACSEPLRTFVKIGAMTGLRYGEIQNLRWKNLDYDQKRNLYWIRVSNQENFRTKSGRGRSVPIDPKHFPSLILKKSNSDPEELIFEPVKDGRLFYPRREWRRVIKLLGFKNFTFHGLRRSFGSLLHQKGVPIGNVQLLMGHSNVTQTRDYIDVREEELAGSAKIFDHIVDVENDLSQFRHTSVDSLPLKEFSSS